MRRISTFCRLLLAAAALTICARPALAQKTTGDMNGTVTDSTGAVLPGVTVTAVCTATNFTRTATTDSQGAFSLPELPVCTYKVTTELPGFKTVDAAMCSLR